jgi:hypothetical protein
MQVKPQKKMIQWNKGQNIWKGTGYFLEFNYKESTKWQRQKDFRSSQKKEKAHSKLEARWLERSENADSVE